MKKKELSKTNGKTPKVSKLCTTIKVNVAAYKPTSPMQKPASSISKST
jgi:hypothetical protein